MNRPPIKAMISSIIDEFLNAPTVTEGQELLAIELEDIYDLGLANGKQLVLEILESEIRKTK